MGAEVVDWEVALRVGRVVAGTGPAVSAAGRAEIRRDFAELVRLADGLVTRFTGLSPAEPAPPPVVLDRGGWVAANLESFRRLLAPLADRLGGRRAGGRMARAAMGLQLGLLLGYLAKKVLGQYDLLLATGGAGRVLFVGPNVVAAERRFGLRPRDFRLWIALHEVTHRTQFAAVPWLRDHVAGLVDRYLATVEVDARRLLEALDAARRLLARGPQAWRGANLVTLFLTPAQQEVVARMQALMTVVEGHGNFVMDRVGSSLIPTLPAMRRTLEAQRGRTSPAERALQRAMGLDLKYAQYAQGERFVSAVALASGMEGVNLVWERAENLPTPAELADPAAWLERVLRAAPAPGS
jgi:coenzyme F420 biosynthesis associated uncharacterized protein